MATPTLPNLPVTDGMVPAVNPQGELVNIPQEDLSRALGQGFNLPSPEQIAHLQRLQAQEGTLGAVKAFGEGAASALTFGASTALETALGVDPKDIEARKEVHPIARGAGTVAGIAGPLIATAGTSAPASGAAAAGEGVSAARAALGTAAEFTAPSLIARAGRAAAGVAETAAGGAEAAGLAARYAPVVAQGLTEGALYAGADVVEKMALGDPQMTAEKAAAEIGLGALFGGVLMGGGKAAAEGFAAATQKAGDLARKAALRVAENEKREALKVVLSEERLPTVQALNQAAPGAADSLASASHPETATYLLDNAARVAAVEAKHPGLLKDVLVKATPEEAAFILDNAGGIISGTMERNAIGKTLTDQITGTFQNTENAVRTAWREARSAEMETLAAKADQGKAVKQAVGIFDDLAGKVEELKRAPELYTPGSGTRLERIGAGLIRDAKDVASPADLYGRLNRLKQSLDDLIPWGAEASTAAGRDTTALLKDLRGKVKSALEDVSVWGEAGERQQAFNKAFQGYKDAAKRLGAGKQGGSLEARILRKVDDGAGGVTYEANEKTVNAWLNAMADARGGKKSDAFNAFLDKAEALAGEMEKSGYDQAPALRDALQKMRSEFAITEHRATVNQVVNRLKNPGQILVSEGYIPTPGDLAKQAGQAVLGGVIPGGGAVTHTVTAAVEKLRSPSMMVGVLGGLDALAQKTSRAIASGVGRIFGGVAEAEAAAGAGEAAARVTRENFRHVAGTLGDLGANLDRVAELTSQETGPLSPHAPVTAETLQALAARGLGHLNTVVPKGPPKLALDADYVPSHSELAQFNRVVEVAQRPAAVLDHVARGTLTQDHLQTLQVIYPKVAEEMRLQVMERLAKHMAKGEAIPRRVRISLAAFLGTDLDSTTTPKAIADAQAAYAMAPVTRAQPPPPPKIRSSVKTDLGSAFATDTQGIAQRLGSA